MERKFDTEDGNLNNDCVRDKHQYDDGASATYVGRRSFDRWPFKNSIQYSKTSLISKCDEKKNVHYDLNKIKGRDQKKIARLVDKPDDKHTNIFKFLGMHGVLRWHDRTKA